jgi:hypothetical protein
LLLPKTIVGNQEQEQQKEMKSEFNESNAFCICTQSEMDTRWKRMQQRLAQFGDIKVQCWEASNAHTVTS